MLNLFRKPTPALLARIELEEAQRQLLAAHSAAEYARSVVLYNETKIKRLKAYLAEECRDAS